jgi:predicted TIM-barrel fold metal-dependent hydrolase
VLSEVQTRQWTTGAYLAVFAAAQRQSVPVCIWTPRRLPELVPVVQKFSDLQFVIDHLGLPQTTSLCRRDGVPFQRLPDLLSLARFPNVAVKITGVPSLSVEPFPFSDVWPPLHRVFSAFGLGRVMWGSNWRAVGPYGETIDYIRDTTELTASDKTLLLGATLRSIFGWPSPRTSRESANQRRTPTTPA